MQLRNKVLLFILLAWALLFFVLAVGVKHVLISEYLHLEEQLSEEAVLQLHGAINQELNSVNATARDWGIWDETYQFAQDKNPGFLQHSISIQGMIVTDVDMMLIISPTGEPIFFRMMDGNNRVQVSFPDDLAAALKKGGSLRSLIEKPQLDTAAQGLMLINGEIVFIGAHSIVTSESKGPARGMIFVGKRLTNALWQKFQKTTELNARFYLIPEINRNPALNEAFNSLSTRLDNSLLERISKDKLVIFSDLKDFNGKPIALIQVDLTRDVYQAGMNSILHFIILFLMLGVLLAALLFYLLNILILKRLETMNNRVMAVGETKDFVGSISVRGADEVSDLGYEINLMINTIGKYNAENKNLLADVRLKLKQTTLLTRKLTAAEALLSNVINSMPSLLITFNKQKKIIQLNREAESALHTQSDFMKGNSLYELLPELSAFNHKIDEVLYKGTVQTVNKIVHADKGESVYFNLLAFPLPESENAVVRLDNVTNWVKLQEKMQQNDKLASIGVLTAGVSHEINGPIHFFLDSMPPLKKNLDKLTSVIKKYTEMCPEDLTANLDALDAEFKIMNIEKLMVHINQSLDDIQQNASGIAGIVKILQVFARLDEGNRKDTDIHDGIDSTLVLLTHSYKDRITVVKEYGDIPHIETYPGRLNQVIMNLITNALHAMPEKGELIIKTSQSSPDQVRISVKDSGTGINSEHLGRIFEPFFTTRDSAEYIGLGLSITKAIVEDLGGTITVKSQVSHGSEFIVTLPVHSGGV